MYIHSMIVMLSIIKFLQAREESSVKCILQSISGPCFQDRRMVLITSLDLRL